MIRKWKAYNVKSSPTVSLPLPTLTSKNSWHSAST